FGVVYANGFSLNGITVLVLTVAVGIVIDDAIIVLENIYRFIEEKSMSPKEAAIEATKEIGLAVLATTLSLVAVFLPVAFMTGIAGRFLNSFGMTMAFAIMVSLLVAFTLTPMLSARWLTKVVHKSKGSGGEETPVHQHSVTYDPEERHGNQPSVTRKSRPEPKLGKFARLENAYGHVISWSLGHRWVVVVTSLLVLFSMGPLGKMV